MMDYHKKLLRQMNSYVHYVIALENSIIESINAMCIIELLEDKKLNDNIISPDPNDNREEQNIEMNINDKATTSKER